MEKIQERALRFIYNDYVLNYEELLEKAKMPSLKVRRLRSIAIFYKFLIYVKSNLFEISYRIYLKLNLSDTHFSWNGYLIGSLPPNLNIHLMAYKKKLTARSCLPSKNIPPLMYHNQR
jgi:hypothetical protein